MKKIIYLSSASAALLIAFTLMALRTTAPDPLNLPVGSVISNILPPDLMNKQYPGQWVLLDGKPLSATSTLYKLLEREGRTDILTKKDNQVNLLPDARGVFIRAMNLSRSAETGDPDGDRPVGGFQPDAFKAHNHKIGWSNNSLAWGGAIGAGNAGSSTSTEGGNETRPRNITLYCYIKISD